MMDEAQNMQDTQGERSRQFDHHRYPQNQERSRAIEKPVKTEGSGLDDEETDEDRSSSRPRPRHGGRPEKKVYEESANDPYCE